MLKLIKFLSPYKGRVTVMLILLFLQVLGTLYIPTLTADIVNHGIVTGNLSHIWKTGSLMLAVAASIAVVSLTETYLSTAIFSRMSSGGATREIIVGVLPVSFEYSFENSSSVMCGE